MYDTFSSQIQKKTTTEQWRQVLPRLSCRLHAIAAPPLAPRLCINDAKVITCSASSAIKWQVHSTLINAEACTPAISGHERWNVLAAALQNKHTAGKKKHQTWTTTHSLFLELSHDKTESFSPQRKSCAVHLSGCYYMIIDSSDETKFGLRA